MSKTAEIDDKNEKEEKSDLKPEEKTFYDQGLGQDKVDPTLFSETDRLQIVRGYQTYEPRDEETKKAFVMINEWRVQNGFKDFLTKEQDIAGEFHKHWNEYIYGSDKYGHCIIGMTIKDIETDWVADMADETLNKAQGQRLTAYSKWKDGVAKKKGVQRYKHTLIVDLKGTGMSLVGGKKRGVLKKVMGIGSDFFPETIWKIYVINTPFIFRAAWAIVSPWIHPVTRAKVHILGSAKTLLATLQNEDGMDMADIPDVIGGKCPGTKSYDVLKKMMAETKEEATAGADTPAAAAPAETPAEDASAAPPSSDSVKPTTLL